MSLRLVLLCLWTLCASLTFAAHHARDNYIPYKRHIPYKRQVGLNLTALNDTITFVNGTAVNGTGNGTATDGLNNFASTVVVTNFIEVTISVTQTVDDGTETVTATVSN